MRNTFEIESRPIGGEAPCYIIAEAGVNHMGNLDVARALVDAACEAGADAIKFQTFRAAQLASPDAPKADYQQCGADDKQTQRELLSQLELSETDHQELQAHCRNEGITFFSTPFDHDSADLLEQLGVPAFKIGSGDLTNLPLIDHVARKQRPLLLSTGMAHADEVQRAVDTAIRAGAGELGLLHCVSCYPAPPEAVNLRAMDALTRQFPCPVGFSDHTRGIEVAIAAVARGARLLEKHLTLDRTSEGPDHQASLEPIAFKAMVYAIRNVEQALGDGIKRPSPHEENIARVARRSLVAARDLPEGTRLTADMLLAQRPGTGIPPDRIDSLIGRRLRQDLARGQPLADDMFG